MGRRAEKAAYRLRPIRVQVVVTNDYLLTLHDEAVSLPALLAVDLPHGRGKGYVVYSVLDAILGSASDALEEVEESLDGLALGLAGGGGGGVPRASLQAPVARLATMRAPSRAARSTEASSSRARRSSRDVRSGRAAVRTSPPGSPARAPI
jgi:hypothetical protein